MEDLFYLTFKNIFSLDNESKNLIFRLKLLNINTAAKHELKNYDGPFVEDSFIESLPPPDKVGKILFVYFTFKL